MAKGRGAKTGHYYFTIHYFTPGKYEVLGTRYRKGAACGDVAPSFARD